MGKISNVVFFMTLALCESQTNRCYGPELGNQDEYPCNKYFYVCKKPHEGYEGYLRLPVLQEMDPQKMSSDERKLFANGDVKIGYSEELDVLHVPEEEHGLRVATDKGNKQNFTIFIKDVYRDRMERLSDGGKYRMDLTIRSHLLHPNHHEYKKDKTIGITSISFGNFICPKPPAAAQSYPTCRNFMIDASMTDGYRGNLVFNIPSTQNEWVAKIKFPVAIRSFNTPVGHWTRISGSEFQIDSLRHNSKQREGHEFHLEFIVHVYGTDDAEKKLNRWKAKRIVEMSFNEYVCRGAAIIWKWA